MELIKTYQEDLLLMKYGDYQRGLASVVYNFLIKKYATTGSGRKIKVNHNLEHNIVKKCTKLSRIDFSLECFTADFMKFSSTAVK